MIPYLNLDMNYGPEIDCSISLLCMYLTMLIVPSDTRQTRILQIFDHVDLVWQFGPCIHLEIVCHCHWRHKALHLQGKTPLLRFVLSWHFKCAYNTYIYITMHIQDSMYWTLHFSGLYRKMYLCHILSRIFLLPRLLQCESIRVKFCYG